MRKTQLLLAMAAVGFAGAAFATNGYFAHGVGVKSQSMGGAGIAFTEDGFGMGANPAMLSQAKAGYAVGVTAFSPDRSVSTFGATGPTTPLGTAGDYDGNRVNTFFIPEFAYVHHGAGGMSYGVAVYGNGGMNADYNQAVYDQSGDKTFTNLEQLFVTPTISMKINDSHTVAGSLVLAYQTFEAGGLDMFTQYTRPSTFLAVPNPLTNPFGYSGGGVDPGNHGKDTATGIGLKLGWSGKLSDKVTMGAFYQPEINMSKFDKYKDLFAEDGDFNIPTNYGVGIAVAATPNTVIAFDIVAINYGDIAAIANKNNHNATNTQLGAADGKGFGWDDMTVFKLGVQHKLDDKNIVRAGWNYGQQPIANDQLDFNLLAPAVVDSHLTLGYTRKLDKDSEVSFSFMHAMSNKVEGNQVQGTGTFHIKALEMSQYSVGIQYAGKF